LTLNPEPQTLNPKPLTSFAMFVERNGIVEKLQVIY
jgi:hypothetical protein